MLQAVKQEIGRERGRNTFTAMRFPDIDLDFYAAIADHESSRRPDNLVALEHAKAKAAREEIGGRIKVDHVIHSKFALFTG